MTFHKILYLLKEKKASVTIHLNYAIGTDCKNNIFKNSNIPTTSQLALVESSGLFNYAFLTA
jgi:hypothetical protein